MLRCMLISMFLVVFGLYGCGDSGTATSSTDESDTSSTTETGTDAAEAVEEADTTEEAAEDVAATDVSAAPETTDDPTPEEDVVEEVEPEPAAGEICPEIFQCLRAACMEGATTTMAEEPAGAPPAPGFAPEAVDATTDSDAVEAADAAAGPTEGDASVSVESDAAPTLVEDAAATSSDDALETSGDAEAEPVDTAAGPVDEDVAETPEELACYVAAMENCGPAVSESENEAALDLVSCMVDTGCSFEDTPSYYECQRNCIEELVTCWSPTSGDGKCHEITACNEDCVDIFGDPDILCMRDCFSLASQEHVGFYWEMELCVYAECHGTGTEEEVDQCLLDELQNATCIEEYSQCYPPIGSAPGAGAGGSK